MKKLIFALLLLSSFSALADIVTSTRDNKINVARIDKVVTLVDKAGIKVNLVVEDRGGSTDVSPTKNMYFTLYSKGEMFSTDATFDLGWAYEVTSAKRLEGGIYEVKAMLPTADEGLMKPVTLKINAINAINAIKSVKCDDFDCAASEQFAATISVTK